MSTRSYDLSKKGSTWWASGKLESGRPFKFECGKGSRETATAVADMKMESRLAASKGSRERWKKFYAEKEAAKLAPPAPAGNTGSSAAAAAPPVVPPSTPAPAAANRSHEVWAKLKALGDASPEKPAEPEEPADDDDEEEDDEEPLKPDEVIAPGASRGDEDEGEDDEEASDMISDAIATAAVGATIKIANIPLKKKGKRGEPDDRFRDLEHKGIKRTVEKLVDGHMKMSPGMQILVGALGTVVTVWLNAEDIVPQQPGAPAAASSPASPSSSTGSTAAAANGNTGTPAPATSTALSLSSQIGVFGEGAGTKAAN